MRFSLVLALTAPVLLCSGPAAAVSTNIVVSEFRTRGPNGANDEFVELFNKSNATVVVTGWRVLVSDSAGNTSVLKQLGTVSIPANRFYLLANNGLQGYSGIVAPNTTYTVGIPDAGGIALETPAGAIVDQVGTSAGSAYLEGTPLAALTASTNQSYERNEGGCSPGRDTDDNSTDFRFNSTRSFPQNSGTVCNPCQGVRCVAPPNPECFTSPGTCRQGVCSYPQRNTGASCNDGDPCTTGDACAADGSCLSGPPNPCDTPPDSFCADPQTSVVFSATGTCLSASGCTYTQIPSACTFGCNGSTGECQPDPCTNVPCNTPPANGCYDPTGTCVAGSCVYTTRSAGTPCTDGNGCTTGDECNANGRCLAGDPVPIDDDNPCTTDRCVRTTGAITHISVADGTSCDDGNGCNGLSVCEDGACVAGTPVTCDAPPLGGCYEPAGTCNPAGGACSYPFTPEDETCDDGDPCTTGDGCDGNGVCQGSTVLCPAPAATCVDANTSQSFSQGACSPATGRCTFVTTDTPCPAGCDAGSGLCNADPCIGVTCDDPPTACHANPGNCTAGTCSFPLKPEGADCDDGDPCTSIDTCSIAGQCAGTPRLCNSPPPSTCVDADTSRQFAATGICASGTCAYDPTDAPCSTGCDAATGLCNGDPCATVPCDEPPTQCHQAQGDCSGGVCTYALKPAASSCDDGALCTVSDECSEAGACAGTPVVCNSPPASTCVDATTSRAFEVVGACEANTGECAYGSTDTTCTTNCDATTGLCAGDPCAGTVCDVPPGACHLPLGTCAAGVCSYTPRASGLDCDDSDPCTAGDVCDGEGVCSGTPSSGAGCPDAGVDGGVDSGREAGTDGGSAGGEAGVDAGVDASLGAGGAGPGDSGTDATSSGGRSGGGSSSDAAISENAGNRVEGGGCACSMSESSRSTHGLVALVAGALLLSRRRTRPRASARGIGR